MRFAVRRPAPFIQLPLALSVCAFVLPLEAGPIFVALPQFNTQSATVLVSSDGSTVAGSVAHFTTGPSGNGLAGIDTGVSRWGAGTTQELGFLPNTSFDVGHGISADGSVIVGTAGGSGISDAFRWSSATGLQRLQDVPLGPNPYGIVASHGAAFAVSADGSTVVGSVGIPQTGPFFTGDLSNTAAIWNAAGQLALLPPPTTTFPFASQATAISADGSLVAGLGTADTAFLGSPGAPNLLNQTIPALFNVQDPHMASNGQMLYASGAYGPAGSPNVGFFWTPQNGVTVLGPGTSGLVAANSTANVASADGSIIGGNAQFEGAAYLHQVYTTGNAMIWDAGHGFQNLYDVLATQYGLATQLGQTDALGNSWKLESVTGMSDDGMVLAGYGVGPNALAGSGGSEAWLVDLRNELANTQFNLGLNGWTVSGQGTATTIVDPSDPANTVAQLTTTSSLSISQTLATPSGPFDLKFDYQFQSPTGILDVYLGSTLVGTIDAPATLGGGLVHENILIDNPSLWNQADTTLTLTFDPPQSSQILLDNFSADPIGTPEPSSCALLVLGCVGLVTASRYRRSNTRAESARPDGRDSGE